MLIIYIYMIAHMLYIYIYMYIYIFLENVYCFEVGSTEIHLDTRITKCSQFTILHELCLV